MCMWTGSIFGGWYWLIIDTFNMQFDILICFCNQQLWLAELVIWSSRLVYASSLFLLFIFWGDKITTAGAKLDTLATLFSISVSGRNLFQKLLVASVNLFLHPSKQTDNLIKTMLQIEFKLCMKIFEPITFKLWVYVDRLNLADLACLVISSDPTHRGIYFWFLLNKPKLDCIYHFPISLERKRNSYSFKSVRKWQIQSHFSCLSQDPQAIGQD